VVKKTGVVLHRVAMLDIFRTTYRSHDERRTMNKRKITVWIVVVNQLGDNISYSSKAVWYNHSRHSERVFFEHELNGWHFVFCKRYGFIRTNTDKDVAYKNMYVLACYKWLVDEAKNPYFIPHFERKTKWNAK
jgi:hypothetical protein